MLLCSFAEFCVCSILLTLLLIFWIASNTKSSFFSHEALCDSELAGLFVSRKGNDSGSTCGLLKSGAPPEVGWNSRNCIRCLSMESPWVRTLIRLSLDWLLCDRTSSKSVSVGFSFCFLGLSVLEGFTDIYLFISKCVYSKIHDYALCLLTCGSCLYISFACSVRFRTPYFAFALLISLSRCCVRCCPYFPAPFFPMHEISVSCDHCLLGSLWSAARGSVDLVFCFDSMSVTQTDKTATLETLFGCGGYNT